LTMEIRQFPSHSHIHVTSCHRPGLVQCSGKAQTILNQAAEIKGDGEDPAALGRDQKTSSTHTDSETEKKERIEKLKARDREVRTHEQAHKVAAGPYAVGGPSLQYTIGPDGRLYAVGGEVKLDTSEVPNNPEATIKKAQTLRRAALAPAEISAQDRQVATEARAMEMRARQELMRERKAEAEKTKTTAGSHDSQTNHPPSSRPIPEGGLQRVYEETITDVATLLNTLA
jgi:hypothetical protein